MTIKLHHKIQTVVMKIHFEGLDAGFAAQDALSEYFYLTISPEIERIMDSKVGVNSVLNIQNLALDCGTIPYENWETGLVETIKRKLSHELQAMSGAQVSISHSLQENYWMTFMHFLEKGHLPWSVSESNLSDLPTTLSLTNNQLAEFAMSFKASSNFYKRFASSISTKPKAFLLQQFLTHSDALTKKLFRRLLLDLDYKSDFFNWLFLSLVEVFDNQKYVSFKAFFTTALSQQEKRTTIGSKEFKLLAKAIHESSTTYSSITKEIKDVFNERINPTFQQNSIKLLHQLSELSSEEKVRRKYKNWINDLYQQNSNAPWKIEKRGFLKTPDLDALQHKTPNRSNSAIKTKDEDALFVGNAGMVIFHPFLPVLFDEIDGMLHEEGKTICKDACLEVMEFLVHGENDHGEEFYIMNKILCGRDPADVFTPKLNLPEKMKKEADDLIKEVIGHWGVLNHPSLEGFRETFLQRNGKLTQVQKGWRLEVEKKGVDVLMGSLPWGLNIITYPWTEKILFVEWN